MSEPNVTRACENTWRIDDGGVRFFLLEGTEYALLIDSGMTVRDALGIARKLTRKPVRQLYTHADIDHIGSRAQFSEFYMHPAEAVNYYKRGGGTGTMLPVFDGTVLDPGGRQLEIITIPGHTPGSIAVLDRKNRILFSGDTVQDGSVFMFGDMRELHAYILSLDKLGCMTSGFDVIFPSHGSPEVGAEQIAALRQCAEDILGGKLSGVPKELFGTAAVLYTLGSAAILYDK